MILQFPYICIVKSLFFQHNPTHFDHLTYHLTRHALLITVQYNPWPVIDHISLTTLLIAPLPSPSTPLHRCHQSNSPPILYTHTHCVLSIMAAVSLAGVELRGIREMFPSTVKLWGGTNLRNQPKITDSFDILFVICQRLVNSCIFEWITEWKSYSISVSFVT